MSDKRVRSFLVGLLVVAATVAGGSHGAFAFTGITDPTGDAAADTNPAGPSPLDVTGSTIAVSPSTVTFTVSTATPFAASDVHEIDLQFDFNADGVADNCLIVNPSSSTASGLQGFVLDGCSGTQNKGTASVTLPSATQLQIDMGVKLLRDAGMGSGSSFAYRIVTMDSHYNPAGPPQVNDQAPDSPTAFALEKLPVVCGSVLKKSFKLTQDFNGCDGDGLVLGKSGSSTAPISINLNGHVLRSIYAGLSCPQCGSGIKVGAFKYVKISGGTTMGAVQGFTKGISFANASHDTVSKVLLGGPAASNGDGNSTAGVEIIGSKAITISGNKVQNNRGVGISVITDPASATPATPASHNIKSNEVFGNATGISFVGNGIKVTSNNVHDNLTDGIYDKTGDAAKISSNTSSCNGHTAAQSCPTTDSTKGNGIRIGTVTAPQTIPLPTNAVLTNNHTDNNDGKGIEASGTNASGSGNTATGNSDATQCAPASTFGC